MALVARVGGLSAAAVASRSFTSESFGKKKTDVRVVSYNVLSDSLCDKDYFSKCRADDCDPATRLERVKRRLQEQMDAGAIICLQEVSRKWGGDLIPLVEANNYNHASALYGNPFNGYMGCAVLWPKNKFAVQQVDLSRIADTKLSIGPRNDNKEKKEKKGEGSNGPPRFRDWAGAKLSQIMIAVGLREPEKKAKEELDVWKEALRRNNCVVMVRLKDKSSGASFVVADYHMPCLFGSDKKCSVMTAHSALLFQHAQKWAGKDPIVIAGDFNIKPRDPTYALMSKGTLDPSHPWQPPSPAPFDDPFDKNHWRAEMKPMRSAYLVKNGVEPEYTNFGADGVFCETLDYIWLSPEWDVKSVRELPSKAALQASGVKGYPSATEPSDHLMISADLQFTK